MAEHLAAVTFHLHQMSLGSQQLFQPQPLAPWPSTCSGILDEQPGLSSTFNLSASLMATTAEEEDILDALLRNDCPTVLTTPATIRMAVGSNATETIESKTPYLARPPGISPTARSPPLPPGSPKHGSPPASFLHLLGRPCELNRQQY